VARERPRARAFELRSAFKGGFSPTSFRDDVVAGLSLPQKSLPPKYFYDAAGSRLFARICRLPEYYVTRAELALTRANLAAIARFAGRGCQLIEYGSGEGIKSRLVIRALRPSLYVPIDISESALAAASRRLEREFPWLRVAPLVGDFSRPLEIPLLKKSRVVYFPGSTIGNLSPDEAHAFLSMSRGVAARMLVGVDLKKDPALLHAAYNDAAGVTAQFNLNLLARINRELGADFDLRGWRHYAFYNPAEGRVEMHLVSLGAQRVKVGGHRFDFRAGEAIHTENSYKYSLEDFRALAARAGFSSPKAWTDRRGLFALHGLQRS
jgi:dimethylhistidine N-methyltransferase